MTTDARADIVKHITDCGIVAVIRIQDGSRLHAVVDALAHLGVTHIDIPITPEKVWRILKEKGVAE